MRTQLLKLLSPIAAALALTACLSGGSSGSSSPSSGCESFENADRITDGGEAAGEAFSVELLAGCLEHPWALAFLPGGDEALVTERPGRLQRVSLSGDGVMTEIAGVPEVAAGGQGGLLDIALHPDFANQPYVYLTYAVSNSEGELTTELGRGRLEPGSDELTDFEVLFTATPFTDVRDGHFGSRIVIDGNDRLFMTVGDRRDPDSAQDLNGHHGKVLRLNLDGSIPADNPFTDNDGETMAIWSYGHRNTQGMAINPATTEIWIADHGPRAGDEVNILPVAPTTDSNYGWPEVSYGRTYGSDEPFAPDPSPGDGFIEPIYFWDEESFAPSGMSFYEGDAFPAWQDSVFIGSLVQENLTRLELSGDTIIDEQALLEEEGWRVRDVREGPDGFLYLLVDEADAPLVRLTPAVE
ncbi:PQQ-dependent sugar dehydrogenase [Methylonatrum kenyense]|uniref:PQQ-dependent sugar dehydrogenase n=1 Tax=Methylonatrum kenyense TaxID=455253 RepID=UPI0020BFD9F3|nr:PQQ-dependent sugar dehydrogenase [Methylonatrum kenyense]MCK8516961.1 PQQ-dependent sugar dehydrogenase [Methylonatrum kenyense]